MRIAHFVPLIACKAGFETNVSGHVQVPLHAMKLLVDAGHEVHLITNAPDENRPVLPAMMPENLRVHYVEDGRVRKRVVDGVGGFSSGIRPTALLRQMRQIRSVVLNHDVEILHTWGYHRTAHLATILRSLCGVPVAATLFNGVPPNARMLDRLLVRRWKQLALVTATQYVADACAADGLETTVIRHGPVRNLVTELDGVPPTITDRVLFWRDASTDNGADVCVAAFDRLAPRYPAIKFEMAIRPHWSEVEGVDSLAMRHKNVRIHRFPYPAGVTLPGLVVGSLCVPMLFRAHSIHPQLVIAETMAAGVPVLGTNVGSTSELVEPGRSGVIVPAGDVEATIDALERMVADPAATRAMGVAAAASIAAEWNWDAYVQQITAVYERLVGRA